MYYRTNARRPFPRYGISNRHDKEGENDRNSGTFCIYRQLELRSRPIEASSTRAPVNAGRDTRGGLLSVTFSSEVTVDSG